MRFKLLIILLFPLCALAQRRTTNNSFLTKSEAAAAVSAAIDAASATYGTIAALNNKLDASTAASTYAPLASPSFTGSVSGITKAMVGLGNVDNTNDASKPVSTATQTALDLKANLVSPSFTTPALGTPASGNLANCTFPTLNQNTTGSAATLTTPRTINGVSFDGSANISFFPQQVATADIAATASATSTTTLFTPSASGMYRISVYLKITTTGTSPVAGPVTITYTDADGSVAQSHVMLLQSTTGTVVTTTVNNSTTTGTVNGSMVINAKTGVAIQYAIAVSGTFGAGRYQAHLICERLK